MQIKHLFLVWSAASIVVLTPAPGYSQGLLERVQALYASAAYEDALATLPTGAATPDIELYRVSCLVALGRTEEATTAAAAVIGANPTYRPEAPPRIQELYRKARQVLIPSIARRVYAEGKAALGRKDRDEAIAGFSEVLRLLDDTDAPGDDSAGELRQLAAGFLDLSRALPVPPAPESRIQEEPSASERTIAATDAVPIQQTLPPWHPREVNGRQFEFKGTIRISISTAGTVDSAVIVDPVEYSYDPLLVKAALKWTYKPATRNGVVVPSQRLVQINLKPR